MNWCFGGNMTQTIRLGQGCAATGTVHQRPDDCGSDVPLHCADRLIADLEVSRVSSPTREHQVVVGPDPDSTIAALIIQ